MTDKQIIIYKKECYNEPHCSLNQVLKQLKVKEQECDMWKNLTVDNGAVALKYQQQIDQLKAENEDLKIYIESNEQQVKEVETLVMDNDRLINELDQLKEQLEAYKMEADEGKEINAELKAENDELKKKCNIYTCGICGNKEDCNKLYKTLTEIKEIANKIANYYDGDEYELMRKDAEQILQKISEVKDE